MYQFTGYLSGMPGRPEIQLGIAFLASRQPIVLAMCSRLKYLSDCEPILKNNELALDSIITLFNGYQKWQWSNGFYYENPTPYNEAYDPNKHRLIRECDLLDAIKEANVNERTTWQCDGVLIETKLDFIGASTTIEPHTTI